MADLSHVDAEGRARMVDIGDKQETRREAVAIAAVRFSDPGTVRVLREASPKGDVLATARLAGIMATKRTAELIPLCHPLLLTHADVAMSVDESLPGVRIEASVRCRGQTGVEMEALTAVSVAGLTLYDMLKSIERGAVLTDVRLVEKTGGKSGSYRAS